MVKIITGGFYKTDGEGIILAKMFFLAVDSHFWHRRHYYVVCVAASVRSLSVACTRSHLRSLLAARDTHIHPSLTRAATDARTARVVQLCYCATQAATYSFQKFQGVDL